MNNEVLRAESDHVRQEWERLQRLNRVQERALQIAGSIARGTVTMPQDAPTADAPEHDWMSYWIKLGSMHLEQEAQK
jgi:hypothetical protein